MSRAGSHWIDHRLLDKRGDLIGIIVDVYEDAVSHRPAWLAVSTGFFGTRIAVVPIHGASRLGDDVVVPHSRHTITTAPHVDAVVVIDPEQQRWLVDHYTPATESWDRPPTSRKQHMT